MLMAFDWVNPNNKKVIGVYQKAEQKLVITKAEVL